MNNSGMALGTVQSVMVIMSMNYSRTRIKGETERQEGLTDALIIKFQAL